MRLSLFLAALFAFLTQSSVDAQSNDKITFPSNEGFILGRRFPSNSNVFGVFLGIPYGEPPLNQLRFQNPIPKAPWSPEILDASGDKKPKCPQRDPLDAIILTPQSENCLYLNVLTPRIDQNDTQLFPVLVYIYGGGLEFGYPNFPVQGTLENLVRKGVVYVSFNYRLGAFGFWTSCSNVAPGNYGFMDQILALKWVQRNIRNFGGDPSRVTLIGYSSGADSIGLLTLSPLATGLFKQGIMMSGSAFSTTATMYPPPEDISTRLARNLNCLLPSAEATVFCLRNQPVSALLDAWEAVKKPDPENDAWGATIGGAFLPQSIAVLAQQLAGKDIKMIIGTTKNEDIDNGGTSLVLGSFEK